MYYVSTYDMCALANGTCMCHLHHILFWLSMGCEVHMDMIHLSLRDLNPDMIHFVFTAITWWQIFLVQFQLHLLLC